jgi:DNA primase
MLAKISDNIVIAYDSDTAGFRASEKVWKMALSMGMDVKIAPIENGQDPADLIKESIDEWKKVIKGSKHIIEIITDQIRNSGLDDRQKGKMVAEKLIPYLKSISSNIDRDHFIKLVSSELSIDEDSIRKEIENYNGSDDYVISEPLKVIKETEDEPIVELLNSEKEVFGLLFWQKSIDKDSRVVDVVDLEEKINKVYESSFAEMMRQAEKNSNRLIFETEQIYASESDVVKMKQKIDDLIKNLEIRFLTKKRDVLKKQIVALEQRKDTEKINEVLTKIQEISRRINDK